MDFCGNVEVSRNTLFYTGSENDMLINNGKTASHRIINIGDIFYLGGWRTKVKVINNPELRFPTCEILEIGKQSRYKIGQKVSISRAVLYLRQGR